MLRKTCTENCYSKQIFDLWSVPGNLFSRAEAKRLNQTKPLKKKHIFKWQHNNELQKCIAPKKGPCSQIRTHELHNFRHTTNTALFINYYLLLQRIFLGADTIQSTLPPHYGACSLIAFSWAHNTCLFLSLLISYLHIFLSLHSTYATSICF